MPPCPRVAVTTTSSLDGWEIDSYLGPVVAHSVAGTSVLSDWLASWSDVLGGRSGSYQKQLRSLSDEAIRLVRDRAAEMGANWVLGLTVDMDEVSGQGKQMFMITAMGTAVRAARPVAVAPSTAPRPSTGRGLPGATSDERVPGAAGASRVSADAVRSAQMRRRLAEAARAGTLKFDAETWSALADHQVAEAAPAALLHLGGLLPGVASGRPLGDAHQQELSRAAAFVGALPAPAEVIASALRASVKEARGALAVAAELRLGDLETALALIDSDDMNHRRRGVQLLRCETRSYGVEDLALLEQLALRCSDGDHFPFAVQLVTNQGGRFAQGQVRYLCTCGQGRSTAEPVCPLDTCGRNLFGFAAGDFTPPQAAAHCAETARTLRHLLGEHGAELPPAPAHFEERVAAAAWRGQGPQAEPPRAPRPR